MPKIAITNITTLIFFKKSKYNCMPTPYSPISAIVVSLTDRYLYVSVSASYIVHAFSMANLCATAMSARSNSNWILVSWICGEASLSAIT